MPSNPASSLLVLLLLMAKKSIITTKPVRSLLTVLFFITSIWTGQREKMNQQLINARFVSRHLVTYLSQVWQCGTTVLFSLPRRTGDLRLVQLQCGDGFPHIAPACAHRGRGFGSASRSCCWSLHFSSARVLGPSAQRDDSKSFNNSCWS